MTPSLEKFHQIMELTMYITTNSYRTIDRLHIGLLNKDLFYLRYLKKQNFLIMDSIETKEYAC